jgi:hypothetical protein
MEGFIKSNVASGFLIALKKTPTVLVEPLIRLLWRCQNDLPTTTQPRS